MCQKIRHRGLKFGPKVGQSTPKTEFQIFTSPPNWGRFAPTLDHFCQSPKTAKWQSQPSGAGPIRGHMAAILAKNVRRGGSSGQTGSRNMAATQFLDFLTPTSYSTPNTLWGLSRTVTELPPGSVTITPLLRPPATRKYSKSRRRWCQLRAHIARVSVVKISRNFHGH